MNLKGLKICFIGHYNHDYSRNRIFTKALRRTGAEVIHIKDLHRFPLRYLLLFQKAVRCEFDLLVVSFPGHTDIPLAKVISMVKGVPIIFDAFISLFDSNVWDRKITPINSLAAKWYFMIDKVSSTLADIILLDTYTHISYFVETFNLPRSKFRRIWVGADDEVMYPRVNIAQASEFTVFFYGSFIPLQGVEYIIKAAQVLESLKERVQFILIGSGQTYQANRDMARRMGVKSVRFVGRVSYEDLPVLISQSHVCLGIFGSTPKTHRVIPNKVFDALAVSRPVITADTPAINEALRHRENIWLCDPCNAKALAEAILTLKQNPSLREYLARNGYQYFKNKFSIYAIASELEVVVKEALNSKSRRPSTNR